MGCDTLKLLNPVPPSPSHSLKQWCSFQNIRTIMVYLVCFSLLYIFAIILPTTQFLSVLSLDKSNYFMYLNRTLDSPFYTEEPTLIESESTFEPEGSLGCDFPKLNPFDPSIAECLKKHISVNCSDKYPLLFKTDLETSLIQVESPSNFNYTDCCYRAFGRQRGFKTEFKWSKNCTPIVDIVTKIPHHINQFTVECIRDDDPFEEVLSTKVVDVHGFIRPPPPSNEQESSIPNRRNSNIERPNVVLFGLDGVSHMNFIRTFPSTHKYITENLSAVGMMGYEKVGDNTFPNMVPVLTGLSEAELKKTCWKTAQDFFDPCPFIWKNFSQNNYLTSFAESAPWVGIFSFNKRGFNYQPTDYYHHTLTTVQEMYIGHGKRLNLDLCIGPRLFFQEMQQITRKMALAAKKASRYYFQLVWATALTHDFLNSGLLGDEMLLETLQGFKSEGYLNNTIFVLMSDHGIRWGNIHDTYQGKVEERMPFLYFILPEWFKQKYVQAVKNLKENAQVLSSPFDLHETLQDILSLKISDKDISKRQRALNENKNLPRGISLFLRIPRKRTCSDAGIADHWCVCELGKSIINPENSTLVREAAEQVVRWLNNLFDHYPECSKLELESILNAQAFGTMGHNETELGNSANLVVNGSDIRLTMTSGKINLGVSLNVTPSNAVFDATMTRYPNGTWDLSGQISRSNLYGNQSACVNDYDLKKYCYCV